MQRVIKKKKKCVWCPQARNAVACYAVTVVLGVNSRGRAGRDRAVNSARVEIRRSLHMSLITGITSTLPQTFRVRSDERAAWASKTKMGTFIKIYSAVM